MRRLIWVLLAAAQLVVGCSDAATIPSSAPEPVTLAQAPALGVDYVAIIGGIDTNGSEQGGKGQAGWAAIATKRLKDQGITIQPNVVAMSGAGYVAKDRKSGRTFLDEVSRAAGANDRLVILFGSRSDHWVADLPTSADLPVAMRSTLAKAKQKAPKATILVIGPAWTTWTSGGPTEQVLFIRDALLEQAAAEGAVFVDPIVEKWFVDRPDLVGSNGLLNDQGHTYLADKIAPLMAHLLPPTA